MRARRPALAAALLWITVSPVQGWEALQAAGEARPTASQDRREQGTYGEMRAYLGELVEQKRYAEAAAMLERILDRFPDHVRYPLFVALHGGGESIAALKPQRVSPRRQSEFLIAWVQSSQVASMTGFHWQDEARTRRDLQAAHTEVVARYPVDPEQVIVGGFSSGGFASLVTAFHQTLPARGFVALCPEVPASLTDDDIAAAVRRKLRGALLTTELDPRVAAQRALAERWKKAGLDVEFTVTPNIGHWFPKDFGQQLDRAIERILAPLPPRTPGWSRTASGTRQNLIGIWGTSGRNVFVGGYGGTILRYGTR
jgi:predicted esterase